MNESIPNLVHELTIDRIRENLRQQRETFDQHKAHENKWFAWQLIMLYSAIFIMLGLMTISGYVLFNSKSFSATAVNLAAAALFTDTLGFVMYAIKIGFKPVLVTRLAPITEVEPSDKQFFDNPPSAPISNSGGLVILSAKYGADNSWMDVTPLLRAKIKDDKLQATATNGEMGTDPIKGVVKRLEVTYSYNGQTRDKKVRESESLFLPEVV